MPGVWVTGCLLGFLLVRNTKLPLPHGFPVSKLTCSGSLLRQLETNSLKAREKFPSSSGGLFFGMRNRTLIGCKSALGGSPVASSIAVIPRDQISAWERVGEEGGEERRGGGGDEVVGNWRRGTIQFSFMAVIQTEAAIVELAYLAFFCPHLCIVCRLFDDLRSHPERGPYKRVPPVHGISELSRYTKVCQLHLPSL